MYVKTLTLKGFKSFASATTMRLEPGITCIVGPNGSGKSNVVDALAWVMGEQGAKSLRGGKMEDVIFAGTSGRAPLGRAEVALTIDNSDGALPIDYTEVTISRTMFRSGGSEYAINGTPCRLLDIQELLSDSGIGREMHIIVGQGQLDTVLRSTPEERRGFIEEAAGVLKHRKRKEKALRKLETMEGNLTRVSDLVSEIRRQLGPLGRQAETARRAAYIQADVRDARLRLLADDLAQLTSALEQEAADESALLAERASVEAELGERLEAVRVLDEASRAAAPELARAVERYVRLQSIRDRLESTASVAAERVRLLSQDDDHETTTGRDPEELRRQAAAAREQEQQLQTEVTRAEAELGAAVTARAEAEEALAAETKRIAALARAAADRREGLAKLSGQVAARTSRIEAGEAEVGRLTEVLEASRARAAEAEKQFAVLEGSIAHDEEGEVGLDSAYEEAAAELEAAQARVTELTEAERTAERERMALTARLEALQLSLRRKDGAAALIDAARTEAGTGVTGTVAEVLQIESGFEAAVSAALGWAAEAVTAESLQSAARALQRLKSDDAGRAGVLISGARARSEGTTWPTLDGPARWARDVVTAPSGLEPALYDLLDRVAIVSDPAQALALVARDEGITAVTSEGDVFAPGYARGGSSGDGQSLLEIQSAATETQAAAEEAQQRVERARFALVGAREQVAQAEERVAAALERLHESDARMSALAEQLGNLGSTARAAKAEAERTQRAIEDVTATLASDREELAALQERLAQASAAAPEDELEPSTDERDRLELAASAARTAETELRLALRTKEERARAIKGRAESLEGAARNELAARERLRQRRERRAREASVASAVQTAAAYAVRRVSSALELARLERDAGEAARVERDAALVAARGGVGELQERLRELTDSVHRDEIARAAQLAKVEQLQAKAVEELGIDPDVLVEEFGPHQPVPVVGEPAKGSGAAHTSDSGEGDASADEGPRTVPFVREEQEKRLRRAERSLSALGRVNPLALEEYAALEERHTFLTQQIEDLKSSKRDLLDIIREVDERVERVFTEAFHDTAAQFERVFARLFPGGEGKLILTDPSDMLTTGIEVEARPPGKKVKRLSLLSGGERSLVAVALLVAIFKARPSPFYIMDEVEAALDDTNLGRLITLFEELRDSSQLIVITHQKRTMEIADALYGVSMRGDGVTTVVSQRLRDVAQSA
ncbi:MAG: chromosome segregation protein SMC [Actinomycetales bacterium]|nr:chromosome segregation protein SMC [Actinomycetales bacterium]